MRSAAVLAFLAATPALLAQTPCLFGFASAASTAHAAGTGPATAVQRLNNLDPSRADCPPVLEPVAAWVQPVRHAAGAAAGTEFHYRILENFEPTARTALLRVNGAVHQIQQEPGPVQGRVPRIAVRGADGFARLYEFAGTAAALAAGLQTGGDPAIYQGSSCNVELAVRDTQGQLAANSYNACSGQWLGWRNLGGTIQGRPALAQQPGGLMSAVVHDVTGSYLVRRFQPGGTSGDWLPLGGLFAGEPALAMDTAGQIYVFGRDIWDALWVGRINPSGQFLGWTFAGGIVRGTPSAAVGSDGVAYAAARDPWGGVSILRVQDGVILGWSRWSASAASGPAIAAVGDGLLHVAAISSSGTLIYRTFAEGTPAGWGPVMDFGGSLRHVAAAGIGGETLLGAVDTSSQLLWRRPSAGEWKSFGIQVAGAGRAAAAP
jgi:hypothetical protein